MHRMLLLRVFLIFFGFLSVSITGKATPLSPSSAERYYSYLDINNKIQLKKIEQKRFSDYAHSKVENALQGYEVSSESRIQAIKEIEEVYKDYILSRVNEIQRASLQEYKNEFVKMQSEEAVLNQIEFYTTPQGQKILAKQKQKSLAMQKVYNELPAIFSEQAALQEQIKMALKSGEVK